MKNPRLWLATSAVAIALAAAACFLALAAWTDNRALQREIAGLQEEHRAALADSRESDRQRQEAEQALALEREEAGRTRVKLADLQAQATPAVTEAPAGPRRALRARVYAGQQELGEAWVLHGGAVTNESGLPADPVVLVDASILRVFRAAAAREQPPPPAPQEVTVHHNYPAQTPYTGWWPVWYVWSSGDATNGPPASPPPPSPPRRETTPSGVLRPTDRPSLPTPSSWPIVTPPRPTPFPVTQPVGRRLTTQPTAPPAVAPAVPRRGSQPMTPMVRPASSGTSLPPR